MYFTHVIIGVRREGGGGSGGGQTLGFSKNGFRVIAAEAAGQFEEQYMNVPSSQQRF